jgi:hypothetical protein
MFFQPYSERQQFDAAPVHVAACKLFSQADSIAPANLYFTDKGI